MVEPETAAAGGAEHPRSNVRRDLDFLSLLSVAPRRAFRLVGRSASPLHAVLFGAIVGTVGALVALGWEALIPLHLDVRTGLRPDPMPAGYMAWVNVRRAIAAPFGAALGPCIGSLASHVLLILLRGPRRSYAASLCAFGYAQAGLLLGLIPVVGGALGVLATDVLQIIGIATLHQTSVWRAAVAVLVPPAILVGAFVGYLVLIFGGMG